MRVHLWIYLVAILAGSFVSFSAHAGCAQCDINIVSGPTIAPALDCLQIKLDPRGSCGCEVQVWFTNNCSDPLTVLTNQCISDLENCEILEPTKTRILTWHFILSEKEEYSETVTVNIYHAGVTHEMSFSFEATDISSFGIGCGDAGTIASGRDGSHLDLLLFLMMILGLRTIKRNKGIGRSCT